jgi:hypothetical protein
MHCRPTVALYRHAVYANPVVAASQNRDDTEVIEG